MKKYIFIAAVLIAVFAFAQDRTITVRESDLSLKPNFTARVNGLHIDVAPATRAFNGARCSTLRTAVLNAAAACRDF